MRKIIRLFVISSFGILSQANSTSFVPITTNTKGQDLGFTYSIQNKDSLASNTFLSTEAMKLQFDISIGNEDVGKMGSLFLVAKYNDNWYQRNAEGVWQPWDREETTLQAFTRKKLEKQEIISVLESETLPAGEFLVYGGYKNEDDQLFYNNTSASMVVFEQEAAALHQIKNKPLLASFFARGQALQSQLVPSASLDVASGAAESSVSQTNLQEIGVDEGDRIKTDGEQLYALETCGSDQDKQCITSYSITAEPAASTQLDQLKIDANAWQQGELYLSKIKDSKHLIHLSNSQNQPIFDIWFSSFYWQDNSTEIKFVDVSQPENMRSTIHISLDTSLISSRLVDNVLYLVTRKNSFFSYPQPVPEPLISTSAEFIATSPSDNPTVPEDQDIDDLLPIISFNDGSKDVPVVKATDCYIPSQNSIKPVNNTLITITAIPLDDPKSHYSTCIAGTTDTFYMSTESLYLATSRYPYTLVGNEIVYPGDNFEMTTEIHKFALAKEKLEYRGSGSVPGHLGWEPNKQPFRMGEYEGVLKVATSKGDTWTGNPTTRVGVLREVPGSQKLEEIGFLDNLGKPGERLFAARFIKNRGYLVTFRQTDPLYVLDFSLPEKPISIGALEIEGYSDYLHPIGENYLLGIGKDAVADDDADRGAWVQGVKLSLFDVSNAENLREMDSIVLGKRGSESTVLYDHHALAWLASGDTATLAIPVQLNDTETISSGQDYSHPSAYYGWSHTGLYTFKINTGENPGIKLEGRLITDLASDDCENGVEFCYTEGQSTQNDRAVIQDDSVHYIHNNSVISSAISDLK